MRKIATGISGFAALALAATTVMMPATAQAQQSRWKLTSCQSNGWGCYRVGTYDSYGACSEARSQHLRNNSGRQAFCAKT